MSVALEKDAGSVEPKFPKFVTAEDWNEPAADDAL